jgi:glycosyltransferase involved in cell wall biosynthesis
VRKRPRLAVIFDAVEERWPSMEYVAEMLVKHLQEEHADEFETLAVKPRFFGGFERVPGLERRKAWNADRFVTRFLTYPLEMVLKRGRFDLFHVADHTYAQLLHVLPARRTGVFCHDVDAFEPVVADGAARWRRGMAQVQLRGLRRAAVVFYSTEGVRERVKEQGWLPESTLVRSPYGVSDEFWDTAGTVGLPPGVQRPFLLHVAGNFPRKRLDILFQIFAEVRKRRPELKLVQQGARLDAGQRAMVAQLGIEDALVQPERQSRAGLATLYRAAELLLFTSEREGFGLPILEALAAGARVVASDIPSFREISGEAVSFCQVEDLDGWVRTVLSLLDDGQRGPTLEARRAQARRFSWSAHASTVAAAYRRLGAAG